MFLDIQECFKRWNPYYWYRNDRLGTPRTLETGSGENVGKVVWTGVYDAFGNCQIIREIVENNLRLPGQYFDEETGLYYNLNRYYDPKTGRYLQTDPAGDGLNPYVYAAANPVNAIDPDGLCAWRMFGGASEMLAGAALIPGTGFIGTGVAIAVILNGMDNLIAGARSLDGEYKPALLEAGINRAIPNQFAASLVYTATQIAIPWGGKKIAQWDRTITLYHGTSHAGAASIRSKGIDPAYFRKKADFGEGFYATTNKQQALDWVKNHHGGGEVLEFKVPVRKLKRLKGLDFTNKSKYSLLRFFRHNRLRGRLHSYDYVTGPLLLNPDDFLLGQSAIIGGQQISFHTQRTWDMLQRGLQ